MARSTSVKECMLVGGFGTPVLLALLMAVHAALAGGEIAVVSLREGQLRRLEQASGAGRVVARLARDPSRYLATTQVGIVTASLLAVAIAVTSYAPALARSLAFSGRAAGPLAVVAVVLSTAFVDLVLGELAPKRLALSYPERWALAIARPVDWLATAVRPVVFLLSASTNLLLRPFGGGASELEETTEISERASAGPERRSLISRAFAVAQRDLPEVFVPRGAIVSLPADMPAEQAFRVLLEAGFVRAPVVGPGGLDDLVGVAHVRDLLAAPDNAVCADCVVQPLMLAEEVTATEAIRRLRRDGEELAIVVDAFGSISGIVTLDELARAAVDEMVGQWEDDEAVRT